MIGWGIRKRVRSMAIAIVVILLAGCLYLARVPVLTAMADYLAVQDDLQPADVIQIMAGEDHRTEYAIRLYELGYGKQLFFTGGWCTAHQYDHGEHGRALAMARGVSAQAILTDSSVVTSTYSEIVRLKELALASPQPIRSVIIVSDAYHMRRVRWTARHVLGQSVLAQVASVPVEDSPFPRAWWTSELSRRYVIDEYLKLAYYRLRYQFRAGPLEAWLVSLDRD